MKYPKFIVVKDIHGNYELRLGLVEFHSYLLEQSDKKNNIICIGGGLFEVVNSKKEIWLYGSSTDYGKVPHNILNKIQLNDDHIFCLELIEDYRNIDFKGYKFVIKEF